MVLIIILAFLSNEDLALKIRISLTTNNIKNEHIAINYSIIQGETVI